MVVPLIYCILIFYSWVVVCVTPALGPGINSALCIYRSFYTEKGRVDISSWHMYYLSIYINLLK